MQKQSKWPASSLALGAAIAFLIAALVSAFAVAFGHGSSWQSWSAIGYGVAAAIWFFVFADWKRRGQ